MSLRRIKVDRIDLLAIAPSRSKGPHDEQFDAIRSFIEQDFIRHAGLSQVTME